MLTPSRPRRRGRPRRRNVVRVNAAYCLPAACGHLRSLSPSPVCYGGATVPHSKGLADLAVLLAKPGQDVHVLELYGSADRSGPAGTLVDRTALAAYRQRLRELDD
jgi:hypothetical protein